MNNEIILTPEELYYLGRFLQARYIDYAYIAAMSDIKQNFMLFEQETKASLVASGVLTEDFSGNVEIDAAAKTLLTPIFFGEAETSLDICRVGAQSTVTVNKFHFCDGIITMVTGKDGKLVIRSVDQLAIRRIVESLLPDDYHAEYSTISEVTEKIVTRFIAAKSVLVGQMSVVKTYIEADGILYQENETCIESVSKEMFVADVYNIVKGG